MGKRARPPISWLNKKRGEPTEQEREKERERERWHSYVTRETAITLGCLRPCFYVLAFNLDTSLAVEIGRDGLKAPSDDVNGIKTWELF